MPNNWDINPYMLGDTVLRNIEFEGLKELIHLSMKAEAVSFLKKNVKVHDDSGYFKYLASEKTKRKSVKTPFGDIKFSVPVIRNAPSAGKARPCFLSKVVSPYMVSRPRFNSSLSWRYLEGLATNDFGDLRRMALDVYWGCDKKRLGPVMTRVLEARRKKWAQRDLAFPKYPFIWVDSVSIRNFGPLRDCRLYVAAGVTPAGVSKLLGACRSATPDNAGAWGELFQELRALGLKLSPVTGTISQAVIDGIRSAYPEFEPTRPDSKTVEAVMASLPRKFREQGTALLKLILESDNGAKTDKHVACFVKHFVPGNCRLAIDLLDPGRYVSRRDYLSEGD
jgi:hypothetical protein